MAKIEVPADLAGDDLAQTLQHDRDRPAVQHFLRLARSRTRWAPACPRRLQRLATAYLGIEVSGVDNVVLLNCGFSGSSRVVRILTAIAAVIAARWRARRQHKGELVRVWQGPRERLDRSPFAGLLVPRTYPSPGPPETPAAPAPGAAGPERPRGQWITRG